MDTSPGPTDISPSLDSRREALERVLKSGTFARADQLRRFLRYVCEAEMEGRGEEINEYAIGVEALGRPEGYSPVEDPMVRNRAYALRQKLEEYYAKEAPEAGLRIELPRGSYRPRFVAPEETPPAPAPVPPDRGLWWKPFAAGVGAAAAVFLGLWLLFLRDPRPRPPAVLREAWGPLLESGAGEVLLCVATPAHFYLRSHFAQPGLPELPAQYYEWYRKRHTLPSDAKLFMLPTHNSPLWGDAVGALTVARVLAGAGAPIEVMPERVAPYPAMRGRNVIILGSPEYSPAAARLLEQAHYRIWFDEREREWVVGWNEGPGSGAKVFAPVRDSQGNATQVHGLITVLPSEGMTERAARTVVLSGVNSAGTQAAAEFFSSAPSLEDLRARFRQEGDAGFPRAYQVVVESTTDATIALTIRYKAHRVLR